MKKKIKILLLVILMVLCSGCTQTLKDNDKKAVVNEETGQTLTANILCKPSDESLYNTYLEYDDELQVKLEDLPACSEFTPQKLEYKNLWETILIKPLAYIILKLGYLVKNMGISVMIIGLLIRLILMPIQIKTVKQSQNLQKIQPEMEKIERKYRNRTDNDSMMAKSQETMMLYKKYNVNPVSGCLLVFLQMPIFFAFLEAINRVPAIFEGSFLTMNLGMTPLTGIISRHNYIYIILIVLIIFTTYLSFKNSMKTQGQNPDMAKQMKTMSIMMIGMVAFASLSLPTAIALYWIVTNGFAVIQNLIIKKTIEKRI